MKRILPTAFLVFLIVAAGFYLRNVKRVTKLSNWEKHMIYAKQADALFDTMYSIELRHFDSAGIVDSLYGRRYERLFDSAYKYQELSRKDSNN